MSRKHDVVVTACGITSPLGLNVEEFEAGMFAGRSGVIGIRGSWVHENFPVPYAAMIPRERLPQPRALKNFDREHTPKSWWMSALATEQILAQVGPEHAIDALVYGTADGISFDLTLQSLKELDLPNFDPRWVSSESSLDAVLEVLESAGHRKIPVTRQVSINSACASGNQAIGIAFQRLQAGDWQRCLAGGVDARCEPSNLLNFHMLGAVTTAEVPPETASRPFSKDRSGFVRGEAAALLLLETREAAEKRGARILGRVTGYGCTSDAYRLTDGREDCASVNGAIRTALTAAGLKPEQIDYVNAHGTSTPLNDRLETKAIKDVFGAHARKLAVSSLKSQVGHSTIASGAVEAIACLSMLQKQRLAPTINLNVPDPDCDLDYVPNRARDARVERVLSNSFGFGGQNACLIFERERP